MLTCSQIRVHLGHVGHPILGDDFYGVMGHWIGRQVWTAISSNSTTYIACASASVWQMHTCHVTTVPCASMQALHAAELAIDHPATGDRMHFSGANLFCHIRV